MTKQDAKTQKPNIEVKTEAGEETVRARYEGLGLEVRVNNQEFTFKENEIKTLPKSIYLELKKRWPYVFSQVFQEPGK